MAESGKIVRPWSKNIPVCLSSNQESLIRAQLLSRLPNPSLPSLPPWKKQALSFDFLSSWLTTMCKFCWITVRALVPRASFAVLLLHLGIGDLHTAFCWPGDYMRRARKAQVHCTRAKKSGRELFDSDVKETNAGMSGAFISANSCCPGQVWALSITRFIVDRHGKGHHMLGWWTLAEQVHSPCHAKVPHFMHSITFFQKKEPHVGFEPATVSA